MIQKATDLEYKSGLTPQQEQAAALLASGKTITDTATDLQVSRATIYRLLQDGLFLAYYNLLCNEVKTNVKNNLFTLQEKAFAAITAALDSDNDSTRLKAATWIIDKIQAVEVGNTNPLTAISNLCRENVDWFFGFDNSKYERLKKQHHLE